MGRRGRMELEEQHAPENFWNSALQQHGNAVTGLAPRVSLHIPWDEVDDFAVLAAHAKELGVSIGAINSNLFQEEDYKLGSLTHADAGIHTDATPWTNTDTFARQPRGQ